MTERLYFTDSYLTAFDASVVETSEVGLRVYLDRTAFYPSSGGQPNDLGTLNGIRVVDVVDEDERIAHVLETPLQTASVSGCVDWARRFDHMQQHSGQHLLSAVFEALYGMKTVSFHLGAESSTVDLETPSLSPAQVRAVEERAFELVLECRPFGVQYEDASAAAGLRKASEREGTLRIISIEGVDRSACGGTHVRSTGEIGTVQIRKLEKIRGNLRVEFLCGHRAQRRAQMDFEALSSAAKLFSAPLDDVPELVKALQEQARDADKTRRKLAVELALRRGAELFAAAVEEPSGLRRHAEHVKEGGLGDEVRALAQGFTAAGRGVFVAACGNPPSVMLATSVESDVHAGNRLKELLAIHGGRGGGSAQMAQASLPSAEALNALLAVLSS
jgi:alanyl-tRNA synthetase